MIDRRGFLKLLSVAPVAPMALNLESVMAEIKEPTVERITNYFESPKLASDVIYLTDVGIKYRNEDPETPLPELAVAPSRSHLRGLPVPTMHYVDITCAVNPQLQGFMDSMDAHCVVADTRAGERWIIHGLCTALGMKIGPAGSLQFMSILLDEPIVKSQIPA